MKPRVRGLTVVVFVSNDGVPGSRERAVLERDIGQTELGGEA